MTIKEFSTKHSLVFFWATIALLIINFIMCAGDHRFDRYNYRGPNMMRGIDRGGYYDYRQQRPMMYDRYAPQGTFEATGTLDVVPSI